MRIVELDEEETDLPFWCSWSRGVQEMGEMMGCKHAGGLFSITLLLVYDDKRERGSRRITFGVPVRALDKMIRG